MRNLYFDTESENILEEKNGKWRILDETNNFKPYARFQTVKEDDFGVYIQNQGDRNYIEFNSLEKIEEKELQSYSA